MHIPGKDFFAFLVFMTRCRLSEAPVRRRGEGKERKLPRDGRGGFLRALRKKRKRLSAGYTFGWIKSHRLPYRSLKTATVPKGASSGSRTNSTPFPFSAS